MASIHIRISHDDDLVIADFADVKILLNSSTQCGDDRTDFITGEHLVHPGFFNIENLALQRQDRLITPISSLLG